ncbi:DDB1- and CUL4-associated factor 12-like [Mya arenaria]|uniref:DDB1- and CUL4-associated factor 12-like n=1 Tax=Mya arenaria TaxID=6604 RepID=UPI0022E4AD4D|nr:DDB1- and CUL4-associated factor 12-like [Mya arenaria]
MAFHRPSVKGCSGSIPRPVNISQEIFRYTQTRQLGQSRFSHIGAQNIVDDYVAQLMPLLFKEREYQVGNINKIFSAQWLNSKQVVYGTKCNKLEVMDLNSGNIDHIPSLKSSNKSQPAGCPCGIHSVAINPSRTLLATGAENTNDLAVYKLPTFDPVCVGERAHGDWIFDICWLDDEFLVTGSRDSYLGLWRIDGVEDTEVSPLSSLQVPEYSFQAPLIVKECNDAKKVRALAYHEDRKELAVLSLNAMFHLWDLETFKSISHRKLPNSKENVCMCVAKEKPLYAIGSQSHVYLVDPRSKKTLSIISKFRGAGIRSVSFRKDIITIGTGTGHILFYDLRAEKYLESGCGHMCSLVLGKGWLLRDENYYGFFMHQFNHDIPNAIYTHQYDDTGTRMFVAGGPLPAGLWGNYAGLWS